ncbi:hypothetical protein [Desulfitobacterium metallireducens]|uniref:hypothetical protein n=1 Tax=Desulfitobacterium metallireducens TaxID=142877 RepID=UPI0002EEDC5A|nr:hypothetical protein [Desulfitobacterium metallireducens]
MRLAKLSQLSENDPQIEILARESAEFIKSIPELKKLAYTRTIFRTINSNDFVGMSLE